MANLKSSIKDIKLNQKRKEENVVFKSRVKNSIKKLKETIVNIDKAYSKGLIKENTRNRQKARLTKKVKEMDK